MIPGIIIVASNNAKLTFFPRKRNFAKAYAESALVNRPESVAYRNNHSIAKAAEDSEGPAPPPEASVKRTFAYPSRCHLPRQPCKGMLMASTRFKRSDENHVKGDEDKERHRDQKRVTRDQFNRSFHL